MEVASGAATIIHQRTLVDQSTLLHRTSLIILNPDLETTTPTNILVNITPTLVNKTPIPDNTVLIQVNTVLIPVNKALTRVNTVLILVSITLTPTSIPHILGSLTLILDNKTVVETISEQVTDHITLTPEIMGTIPVTLIQEAIPIQALRIVEVPSGVVTTGILTIVLTILGIVDILDSNIIPKNKADLEDYLYQYRSQSLSP